MIDPDNAPRNTAQDQREQGLIVNYLNCEAVYDLMMTDPRDRTALDAATERVAAVSHDLIQYELDTPAHVATATRQAALELFNKLHILDT